MKVERIHKSEVLKQNLQFVYNLVNAISIAPSFRAGVEICGLTPPKNSEIFRVG
jgi:hypothetical protein